MKEINFEPQQILLAANAGLTLLQTPGAIKVDGPMAISGDLGILNNLLAAIVQRQLVIVNANTIPDEDASPEGDGAPKPDLKPVPSKKEVEK